MAASDADVSGDVVEKNLNTLTKLFGCLLIEAGDEADGDEIVMKEIYDLPEQNEIRNDCHNLVEILGNDEADKLAIRSDIETIITTYSNETGNKYYTNNGWLEIIQPLIALRLSKYDIYKCLRTIRKKYVPSIFNASNEFDSKTDCPAFHLLRLLLLYHDPEFCSFLDTRKISPDLYAKSWFRSLFASHCKIEVLHILWDNYFKLADPFLIFFLALVMLVNAKEQIMEMKYESRENIIESLNSVPGALDVEDIEDLFYLVEHHYISRTPLSIKNFHSYVFSSDTNSSTSNSLENNQINLAQTLCVPVPVDNILPNAVITNTVKYFVVDCRPAEQYNVGHLSTAFHLDCSLMLQEPSAFNTAVDALLAAQKQAIAANSVAGGHHLCFIGSGRDEEDRYVHMVVASFLQKHYQFVSLAVGGYLSLHQILLEKAELERYLIDHSRKHCIACRANNSTQGTATGSNSSSASSLFGGNGSDGDNFSSSIFDKVAHVVKSKSSEVKGKLVEYITNPGSQIGNVERHVSSKDKLGKRYKASKFAIAEDNEGDGFNGVGSDDESREEINVETWCKRKDILGCFKCQEIKDEFMIPSYLILSKTHLFVLREIPHNKGFAKVMAKRPLELIVQITSKRRCPELITFKYGQTIEGSEGHSVIAMDHLLIPKPFEITRLVKQQVIKVLDGDQTTADTKSSNS